MYYNFYETAVLWILDCIAVAALRRFSRDCFDQILFSVAYKPVLYKIINAYVNLNSPLLHRQIVSDVQKIFEAMLLSGMDYVI